MTKPELRKTVYNAIHTIITCRPRNTKWPVQPREIVAFTQLTNEEVRSALQWLDKHLLAYTSGGGWVTQALPTKQLCWLHGRFYDHPTECPKCFRKKMRASKVEARKDVRREKEIFRRVRRLNRGTDDRAKALGKINGAVAPPSVLGERLTNFQLPSRRRPSWYTGLPEQNYFKTVRQTEEGD